MEIYCKCIDIAAHAARLCSFSENAKVLDVGCGDGHDVKVLSDMGFDVSGQDSNKALIASGKNKYPELRLRVGSDDSLDDLSRSHDGVFFLWELSLAKNQIEAIHEAYCLLKPGGKLVISDIYLRAPEMERFKRERDEAIKLWDAPRKHEDCETAATPPSPFCQDGAFVRPALDYLLEKSDFKILHWEDLTPNLKQLLEASPEPHEDAVGAEFAKRLNAAKIRNDMGYFMMIAEKI